MIFADSVLDVFDIGNDDAVEGVGGFGDVVGIAAMDAASTTTTASGILTPE